MGERKQQTIELCYHKEIDGSNCGGKPTWSVRSDKTAFRICDKHLAWGIRLSGAPAFVEEYKAQREDEDTVRIKPEPAPSKAEKKTVQFQPGNLTKEIIGRKEAEQNANMVDTPFRKDGNENREK